MRLGEELALRWDTIDLEAARARVVVSLQHVGSEVRVVEPKTDRARRQVALIPSTVALCVGIVPLNRIAA